MLSQSSVSIYMKNMERKGHTWSILTCFASLSGESSCQLTLYLLKNKNKSRLKRFGYFIVLDNIVSSDKYAHTDRRSEPLKSFHLENLTTDVSVAFRVLL